MTTDRTEPLAAATRHRPVTVTKAGMRQQVCGHDGCRAQRLSRPDGHSWGPCWHPDCHTTHPPIPLDPRPETAGEVRT